MLNYQKQEKVRNDVFKEQNDYVSIYASNYSAKLSDKWELVDGLGYSGKVMSSTYVNLENLSFKDSSILSYDFINTTEANPTVHIFTIPTHPLNNLYSLKYAVRIDGGIWQVKDFATKGRSNEWKENVLSNISEQEVLFNTLKPGKHKLQILAIDPGVMIDRFIIDMGKWKPAYSILKETK